MSKVTIYKGNGSPIVARKQGRNDPCRCGSGKKAKNCCGTETKYFNSKPNPLRDYVAKKISTGIKTNMKPEDLML